ncbi:MAG: hypothetical protein ABIY35_03605 [Chitinophagaceae bacterium]
MKNILFLAFLFVPLLHQNLADPNALPKNGQIIRLPNGEEIMILTNDLLFNNPPTRSNQFKTTASPSDSTPANCDWNLNDSIFAEVDSTALLSYAKPGARPIPDYYDVSFSDDKLGSDFVGNDDEDKKTCNNIDACSTDETKSLNYKAYFPKHNYSAKKLPWIVIAHAGGFSDCSTMNYLAQMCIDFAKRGFVVFNVEYRRGRIKDVHGYTCVQQQAAFYRASQDVRGAIRSFIQLDRDSSYRLPYRIDTTKLFIGGQSAGATAMINAAYYPTQAMVNAVFPTPAGQLTIDQVLGPIDADYYYGGPDVYYLSKIKGVFSMWGGVPIPIDYKNNQSDFFYSANPSRNPSLISFMGYKDPVFQYKDIKQDIYFSPVLHAQYNTDTFCLIDKPFTLDPTDMTVDGIMGSSINLYRILKILGIPTEFNMDCQMFHGLNPDGPNFKSEFGTHLTTQAQVNLYMIRRICCYFQLKMNNLLGSLKGTNMFVECENFRHNCDTLANNNGCNATDTCGKN